MGESIQMSKESVTRWVVATTMVTMVAYHFYVALVGVPEPMLVRPVHVGFVLFLGFLTVRARKSSVSDKVSAPWYDLVLAVAGAAGAIYLLLQHERVVMRLPFFDPVLPMDWAFGLLTIILVLELCRRVAGVALPILTMVLLAYTLVGHHLPGVLGHPPIELTAIFDEIYLTNDALFGGMANLSLTIVFMFVTFGALLQTGGGGQFLTGVVAAITRNTKGGPAKGAVVGSALFGAISGSGVANVYATGSVTIPMMIRAGFRREFAAAMEAVASQLGQLIPPVMGAAAFLVAEFSRVSYSHVMMAAIVPSLLYIFAIYVAACAETGRARIGIYRDPDSPDMSLGQVLYRYGHALIPIGILIYFLAERFTPYFAATVAAMSVPVVSWLRSETRMTPRNILAAVTEAGQRVVSIAAILLTAGIIIGTLQMTGVPFAITGMIVKLAGDSLPLALFLIALITIVLGMGMPVTGAFLIASLFGAAALTHFGVPPFVAYMYIFMFGLTANITPPVCIATFAAAGIAETSFLRAGVLGFLIGLPAYIIPVMIVFDPTLLMLFENGVLFGILAFVTAMVGIFAFVSGTMGWLVGHLNILQRLLLMGAALASMWPGVTSDAVAAAVISLIAGWQLYRRGAAGKAGQLAIDTSDSGSKR